MHQAAQKKRLQLRALALLKIWDRMNNLHISYASVCRQISILKHTVPWQMNRHTVLSALHFCLLVHTWVISFILKMADKRCSFTSAMSVVTLECYRHCALYIILCLVHERLEISDVRWGELRIKRWLQNLTENWTQLFKRWIAFSISLDTYSKIQDKKWTGFTEFDRKFWSISVMSYKTSCLSLLLWNRHSMPTLQTHTDTAKKKKKNHTPCARMPAQY